MQQAEGNAASPKALQAVAHLVGQGVGRAGGLCTAQAAQGCRQVQVSGGVSTRQTGRQAWEPRGRCRAAQCDPAAVAALLHCCSHRLAPIMVPENASTTDVRNAQSTGRLRSRVMGVPEAPSADDPGLHKNIAAQWHLVGPQRVTCWLESCHLRPPCWPALSAVACSARTVYIPAKWRHAPPSTE